MGIFIRTNAPEPPGTMLNLSFAPPGGPQLDLEGRVMWVNPFRPGATTTSIPAWACSSST